MNTPAGSDTKFAPWSDKSKKCIIEIPRICPRCRSEVEIEKDSSYATCKGDNDYLCTFAVDLPDYWDELRWVD